MKGVAEYTGGTFYKVSNPKSLPKIFIKEATMVSRTLIIEGDFTPGVMPTVAGPTRGVTSVPPVGGFILTMPKEGLVQVPMTVATEEEAAAKVAELFSQLKAVDVGDAAPSAAEPAVRILEAPVSLASSDAKLWRGDKSALDFDNLHDEDEARLGWDLGRLAACAVRELPRNVPERREVRGVR